jgi:hypothetical protein
MSSRPSLEICQREPNPFEGIIRRSGFPTPHRSSSRTVLEHEAGVAEGGEATAASGMAFAGREKTPTAEAPERVRNLPASSADDPLSGE